MNSIKKTIVLSLIFITIKCCFLCQSQDVQNTTVESNAPEVLQTDPSGDEDNDENVSIKTDINVTFNRKMDNDKITTNIEDDSCLGTIQLSKDNFSTCIKMQNQPLTSDNIIFTIKPEADLLFSTVYKVRVTKDAKDTKGNNMAADYTSSNGFTTEINLIVDMIPADGAIDVNLDTSISITFYSEMNANSITVNTLNTSCSGSIQISKVTDSFALNTCLKLDSNIVTTDNKLFVIKPIDFLLPETGYFIRITADVTSQDGYSFQDDYTTINGFITSKDHISPTVGGNGTITLTNTAHSSLDVNWTKASDNFTDKALLEYKVVYADSLSALDTVAGADALSGSNILLDWTVDTNNAIASPLTPASTLWFNVLVKDVDGNKGIYEPKTHTMNDAILLYNAGLNDGFMGFLDGANALCDGHANKPDSSICTVTRAFLSFTSAGYYISDIPLPASTAISGPAPNYTIIADDKTDLLDGTIINSLQDASVSVGYDYWTGSLDNGNVTSFICDEWGNYNVSAVGTHGNRYSTTSSWLNNGTESCTLTSLNLICICY
jgi:hypothetical protein